MALKDIKPGKYKARAVEGAWSHVGPKETPAVGIHFEFMHESKMESIWHIMYLTQTALKDGSTVASKTFNTLAMLGYDETQPLVNDEDGNPRFYSQHLADKEVEIVIEHEPNPKDPTKHYTKVRWVNELGGNQMAGKSVQSVLGNTSLQAEMAAARARVGAKKPQSEQPHNKDIPF